MRRNEGFTLLELVVATTVLLIMTLMLGALFRQATSAWDTGRVRGEGNMIARGIIGAVARDLATAIDGTPYGEGFPNAGGSSLEFVCLKPASAGSTGHEVHKIKYSVSGSACEREDSVWNGAGGNWKKVGSSKLFEKGGRTLPFTIDNPGNTFTEVQANTGDRNYEDDYEDAFEARWTGPKGVKVRITFTQTGSFAGVAVRSLGKNGVPDGTAGKQDDDVIVR